MAFVKFVDDSADKEADIVTAFTNDNFLSTTSSIEAVAYAGNLYYSEDAKKDMILQIADKLNITDNYSIENVMEDNKSTQCFVKNSKYAITEIKFVTVKNEKDQLVTRQYIMVDIDILNSIESAVLYRDKVEKILTEMNLTSDVTMTLKGNIKGELSNDEKDNITDNIIKSLDGEIVTEHRETKLYTVYAYSDKIDDYVVSGTDKINVNVAINYDENLNETNIYMATPMINEEY